MARVYALLAGAVLAFLALAAAPARAQSTPIEPLYVFPPLCSCERNANKSPYRLTFKPPVTEAGWVKHCFTVVNVGGCDPKYKCCNGQQGVEKVEFEVGLACKDPLRRVTVDGINKAFEYNTKLSVLRVTNLAKTNVTAPGTEICLFMRADSQCTTLSDLCPGYGGACKYAIFNEKRDCCPVSMVGNAPPPPQPPSPSPPFMPIVPGFGSRPPPPPAAFPWCNCERAAEISKLTILRTNVSTVSNLTRACFTVETKSAMFGSPCNEFGLYKFELDADPVCASSLVYTTVDGNRRARFFQQRPYPVVKVTPINKPYSASAGTEICLFLRAPCTSLEQLCKGPKCTIALFNKPGSKPNCCPLSYV